VDMDFKIFVVACKNLIIFLWLVEPHLIYVVSYCDVLIILYIFCDM
jgi:hypothetical protein